MFVSLRTQIHLRIIKHGCRIISYCQWLSLRRATFKQKLVLNFYFMSEYEFGELTLDEKAHLVFSEGTLVADAAKYGSNKIALYSLNYFWVEVYYNPDGNSIVEIESAGSEEMKKYLNKIKINLER